MTKESREESRGVRVVSPVPSVRERVSQEGSDGGVSVRSLIRRKELGCRTM